MAIFGCDNLAANGDFLIPNKVSLKTVLMLEKHCGKDKITYLVEENLPPDDAIAEHLTVNPRDGVLFHADKVKINSLRSLIVEKIQQGRHVIFLPGKVPHVKGAICQIPPRVLNTLAALHIAPVPVYVGFFTNTILGAEADVETPGVDTQVHLLPKLESGPAAAVRLTAAWMECSARVYEELPQLKTSLAEQLFRSLKQHAHCRVIDGVNDKTYTFREILAVAVAFSRRLKKITTARRVGVILPPGPAAVIANLACLFADKVPVNFNYSASVQAFSSAVRQSGVDRYITVDVFIRRMADFPWPPQRDIIFFEREIATIKGSAFRWGVAIKLLGTPFMLRRLGLHVPSAPDEAVLLFTSGSSGEPKGVPLSNHNILGNIAQCSSRITLDDNSRFLGSLPVFHSFGITIGMWYPILAGYDLITYVSPLESKRLGTLIEQYAVNLVVTTPTFLRGFLKRCELDTFRSVKYLIVGAEKLPQDLAQSFQNKFNVVPCEGYGLTEASPVCSVNFVNPEPNAKTGDFVPSMKADSVGALLPGMAVKVTNPHNGQSVPMNETGVIWLKGPNIFPGYLGKAHAEGDVFADGWFKTGDVGNVDEFGFLTIQGRISRFSKIGGEMVSHEALETAIGKILGAGADDEERYIAIVTIADQTKGEATALLVREDKLPHVSHDASLTIIRHGLIEQGLPALWCPKEIVEVESIPVLPSGKLDLKQCKLLVEERLDKRTK